MAHINTKFPHALPAKFMIAEIALLHPLHTPVYGNPCSPVTQLSQPVKDKIVLIGAVLFEQNDEWQTSSRYMMAEAFAQIDKEEIDPILSITTKAA